jgi:hypothetical protein
MRLLKPDLAASAWVEFSRASICSSIASCDTIGVSLPRSPGERQGHRPGRPLAGGFGPLAHSLVARVAEGRFLAALQRQKRQD